MRTPTQTDTQTDKQIHKQTNRQAAEPLVAQFTPTFFVLDNRITLLLCEHSDRRTDGRTDGRTTMQLLMRGDVNDVDGDSDGNYKLSME